MIYIYIFVNSIEVKLFLLRYQAIYLLYLSVYSKWTDITIAVPFSERTPFKIFALSSDSMSQWWQNIIVTGEVVASEDYDISWNNHSKLKQPHITQDHSMLPKNHHSASQRPQHRRGGRASLLSWRWFWKEPQGSQLQFESHKGWVSGAHVEWFSRELQAVHQDWCECSDPIINGWQAILWHIEPHWDNDAFYLLKRKRQAEAETWGSSWEAW